MPKSTRIREGAEQDARLVEAARLVGELADEQCGRDASFRERSAAARRVLEAAMSEAFEGDDDGHEREDPER